MSQYSNKNGEYRVGSILETGIHELTNTTKEVFFFYIIF